MTITGAVEGVVDEAVLRRIGDAKGIALTLVYVTDGKANLLRRLPGFNNAARFAPWIVLMDLNAMTCAPEAIGQVLPAPAEHMRLRLAVRAIEAWLLADRERLSQFLAVAEARIPLDPDAEVDPKATLVNIARHSRRRAIRDDVVPRPGGGRRVGPAYAARMIEFASLAHGWRPEVAATHSDSLSRCLRALD